MLPSSKEPLLADPTPHKNVRRHRLGLLTLVAFCLLTFQCLRSWTPRLPLGCNGPHSPSDDGEVRYDGEKIAWKPCGSINDRDLECSGIDVPMDQFHPDNSKNKTFYVPLIRLRGKNATQNLLLNPGGPGGSGLEFVHRRGKQLSDIVGQGFHLLSFDPRGVNMSSPKANCYPTSESRRELSDVHDVEPVHDSPEAFAWAANFVRACSDTMGEHGAYINTPQTAADMNSILDAVGQDEMYYWGFSYGTTLGQTHAQLFPERSRRVIIDGVSNNFNWYGSLLETEPYTDTENVFKGFIDECIKAGDNCTLSALADSKESLHRSLMNLTESLKSQPISVYVNNTLYGLLDYPAVWDNAIFTSMYSPARWYSLADNLAKLLQGNATAAFLAYARGGTFDGIGDANGFVELNDYLSGPEYFPQSREEMLDLILPATNFSIFSPSETSDQYARQQWLVPRTHNHTQKESVETVHPLLILSTTYDPICPLVSAKSALSAFKHSRLVEVQGYGHCSVAVASTCLAKRVRAFLYDGTLPDERHTKCVVDGPYFIKPEEEAKINAMEAQRIFQTPEEEEEFTIRQAQLELARNWEWRPRRSGLPMPV